MPDAAPQHPSWDAEALWQALVPLLPGLSVEVVARADSTNTQLLERARHAGGRADQPITRPGDLESGAARAEPPSPHGRRAGDVQPCLLVAEHQTAGRGRQGRPWQSSAGASLTFSLSLPLAPRDWGGLSLAVGLALAEAIDAGTTPARVALKWPNDLWLRDDSEAGGRKLGGVLIETLAVGSHRMVVVGVGLNVAPQSIAGLSSGYACVQEILPGLGAPATLHRVALPLVRALQRFESRGFDDQVRMRYTRRDLLRSRAVVTLDGAGATQPGVAEGVAANGALLVRRADGTLEEVTSGDVSVRLASPSSGGGAG
jgi:BirA family biotin operon repressor/biotin-[acetyl-CoA-carboxylase] ligase